MLGQTNPVTTSLGFGIERSKTVKLNTDDSNKPPTNRKPRILVVDPDAGLRRIMSTRLGAANYAVDSVETAQEALDFCVRSRPHLVISDLRMEPIDGLALLRELKSRWPEMTVIILTAHGTIPDAVRATQAGAFGFLVKPVERAELLGQVERAIAVSTYSRINGDWRANIVSRSQLMEDRLAQANLAAGGNAAVLLTGENGTGKELLARAIHAAGPTRDQLFVSINCRNPDEHALAFELFGNDASQGALRSAMNGTLMLDEIGDLPQRLQARLINALQTEAGRLVRTISTTCRDLRHAVERGDFRQDLYYQVGVMPIEVPPLGRRREDIPLLVSHFLEQATEKGSKEKIYTPKAIELLATTDWPGNVRQLFELVKQNVALTQGDVITEQHVQESLGKDHSKVPSYHEARRKFAREYLVDNLQRTAGNVSESARLAKRNRTDFYKLLARFRLHADDFKRVGPETSGS